MLPGSSKLSEIGVRLAHSSSVMGAVPGVTVAKLLASERHTNALKRARAMPTIQDKKNKPATAHAICSGVEYAKSDLSSGSVGGSTGTTGLSAGTNTGNEGHSCLMMIPRELIKKRS